MDFRKIISGLKEPFAAEDIEWKTQYSNNDKTKGFAVPYVRAKAIQDRLDSIIGPENWRNEYILWREEKTKPSGDKQTVVHKESQLCGIGIYHEGRNEWVTKYDGAENTDIEAIKGGLTDAFKRAAVLWGIGRYLRDMEGKWVDLETVGRSQKIKSDQYSVLNSHYNAQIAKLKGKARTSAPKSNSQNTAPLNNTASPKAPTPIAPPKQAPPPIQPDLYYIQNMKSSTKHTTRILDLIQPDGEIKTAYMKDAPDEIVAGIYLTNVVLAPIPNSFKGEMMITNYEIVTAQVQAAA